MTDKTEISITSQESGEVREYRAVIRPNTSEPGVKALFDGKYTLNDYIQEIGEIIATGKRLSDTSAEYREFYRNLPKFTRENFPIQYERLERLFNQAYDSLADPERNHTVKDSRTGEEVPINRYNLRLAFGNTIEYFSRIYWKTDEEALQVITAKLNDLFQFRERRLQVSELLLKLSSEDIEFINLWKHGRPYAPEWEIRNLIQTSLETDSPEERHKLGGMLSSGFYVWIIAQTWGNSSELWQTIEDVPKDRIYSALKSRPNTAPVESVASEIIDQYKEDLRKIIALIPELSNPDTFRDKYQRFGLVDMVRPTNDKETILQDLEAIKGAGSIISRVGYDYRTRAFRRMYPDLMIGTSEATRCLFNPHPEEWEAGEVKGKLGKDNRKNDFQIIDLVECPEPLTPFDGLVYFAIATLVFNSQLERRVLYPAYSGEDLEEGEESNGAYAEGWEAWQAKEWEPSKLFKRVHVQFDEIKELIGPTAWKGHKANGLRGQHSKEGEDRGDSQFIAEIKESIERLLHTKIKLMRSKGATEYLDKRAEKEESAADADTVKATEGTYPLLTGVIKEKNSPDLVVKVDGIYIMDIPKLPLNCILNGQFVTIPRDQTIYNEEYLQMLRKANPETADFFVNVSMTPANATILMYLWARIQAIISHPKNWKLRFIRWEEVYSWAWHYMKSFVDPETRREDWPNNSQEKERIRAAVKKILRNISALKLKTPDRKEIRVSIELIDLMEPVKGEPFTHSPMDPFTGEPVPGNKKKAGLGFYVHSAGETKPIIQTGEKKRGRPRKNQPAQTVKPKAEKKPRKSENATLDNFTD